MTLSIMQPVLSFLSIVIISKVALSIVVVSTQNHREGIVLFWYFIRFLTGSIFFSYFECNKNSSPWDQIHNSLLLPYKPIVANFYYNSNLLLNSYWKFTRAIFRWCGPGIVPFIIFVQNSYKISKERDRAKLNKLPESFSNTSFFCN